MYKSIGDYISCNNWYDNNRQHEYDKRSNKLYNFSYKRKFYLFSYRFNVSKQRERTSRIGAGLI
jgi:hypothetical protein